METFEGKEYPWDRASDIHDTEVPRMFEGRSCLRRSVYCSGKDVERLN